MIAFFKDNQNAIICDINGDFKKLNWKINPTNSDDFQVVKDYKKRDTFNTTKIQITENQRKLIMASTGFVRLVNVKTGLITKEYKLSDIIQGVEFIENGTKLVISEWNNKVSVINIKSRKILATFFCSNNSSYQIEAMKIIY